MRPLNGMSTRIGVWVESQSCVSCGEVWKYHAILPVSTFTAISARREEVVAFAAALRVRRRRVARAVDVELRLRIVRAGNPRRAVAVARGVEARPGLEARIARVLRRRVQDPLHRAGARIERLQERRARRGRCRCRRARGRRSPSGRSTRSTADRAGRSRAARLPCRSWRRGTRPSCRASSK